MEALRHSPEAARLLGGIALAALLGLSSGAALRPDLREDARPRGPQILAGVSADRTYATGQVQAVSYSGEVPAYVIGTDWLQPPAGPTWSEAVIEPEADAVLASAAFVLEIPAPPAPPSWIDEPQPPPAYPSLEGGRIYVADARPPAG